MMDEIDKLLAQVDAAASGLEAPVTPPRPMPTFPHRSIATDANDTQSAGTIDALLTRLGDAPPSVQVQPIPPLPIAPSKVPSYKPSSPVSIPPMPPSDPLLSAIRSDYAERDRQAEQQRQAQLRQEQAQQQRAEQERQQRLEDLRQQRRAELIREAEQWLRTLKPKSKEGQWFAEFSCRYDSPLEAAIDYLEALQDVDRLSTSEPL